MADQKTLGIIFLGGKGLRLGGRDKSEIIINGQTCFDRVHQTLSNHSAKIALSRPYNGKFSPFPVIPDWPSPEPDSCPALALLGCLSYAANYGYDDILTSSVDTPFLPEDFGESLSTSGLSAVAQSGDHQHNLHARWSCKLLPELKTLILNGERGMYRLHKAAASEKVMFGTEPHDPFFNINRPEDLKAAESLAQKHQL